MIKISCIILNYNDEKTTSNLVNAIKDYSSISSIIIVDNLSNDGSYEKLLRLKNDKIKVIQTKKNGGYGYGNNEGIRFAYNSENADYILIANPDVHFTNDTVNKMKEFLLHNQEYAICAPTALKPNGETQNLIAWRLQSLWDYALSSSMIYLKFFSNKFYKDEYFSNNNLVDVDVDVVPGSLLMVNAQYMIEHGMYDENNFLYSEEEMLAIKFKNAKLKTKLLLNESYIHEHSVSISKSFPSEYNKKKMNLNSRLFVLNKYYKTNALQKRIFKLISKLAIIENKIIFKLKGYN